MKLANTENAGYRIIASTEVNTQANEIFGVVVAERINKIGFDDYVTWEYNFYGVDKNIPSYYWGHYYKAKADAVSDYRERVRTLTYIDR